MFTLDQKKAHDPRRHVSITANAGSGKTRVLVSRYCDLVELYGVWPDAIAAITFTEKAASELRNKIAQEIERRLDDEEHRANWLRLKTARERFTSAIVTTIHGFSSKLLREFPIEAEVPPNFGVVSGFERRRMEEDALMEAIEAALGADGETGERVTLAYDTARRIGREKMEDILRMMMWKREIIHFSLKHGALARGREETLAAWRSALRALVKNFLFNASTIPAYDRLIDVMKPEPAALAADALARARRAEEIEEILAAASELRSVMMTLKGKPMQKSYELPKDELPLLDPIIEPVALAFDRADAFLKSNSDPALHEQLHDDARILLDIHADAVSRYADRKRRINALDFEDLQLRLLEALDSPDAFERMRGRFAHIMVDEFQDTNELQYRIVDRLLDRYSQGKLCIVGDEKQSIYGFRNAEVEVFKTATSEIKLANRNSELDAPTFTFREEEIESESRDEALGVIKLDASFRLLPSICAYVNESCAPIMRSRVVSSFGVDYDPLVCARRSEGRGRVEVIVSSPPPEVDEEGEDIPSDEIDRCDVNWCPESEMIARRLLQLVAEGIEQIHDCDEEGREFTRRLKFSDMAILCRKRSHFPPLENALRKYGVPFIAHGSIGFYKTQEIYDTVNYLRTLLNSRDEIALLGVMRSPYFCVSDTELYRLATMRSGDAGRDLWSRAVQRAAAPDAEDALVRAVGMIAEDRSMASRIPVSLLIRRVLEKTGWRGAVAGSDRGEQVQANLDKLLEMAREFEERGFTNLFDFVERLTALIELEEMEGEASVNTGRDAVRIMTMHAAKGLEFPLVVIPSLHSAIRNPSQPYFDKELGFGWSWKFDREEYKPMILALMNMREQERGRAEEARLFYVAVTRARDMLLLSGEYNPEKGASGTMLEWALAPFGEVPTTNTTLELVSPELTFLQEDGVTTVTKEWRQEVSFHVDVADIPKYAPYEVEVLPLDPELVVIGELPARAEGEVYSATQFLYYSQCPTKYYLLYRLGIPQDLGLAYDIDPNARDSEEGTIFARLFRLAVKRIDEVVQQEEPYEITSVEEAERRGGLAVIAPAAPTERQRVEKIVEETLAMEPLSAAEVPGIRARLVDTLTTLLESTPARAAIFPEGSTAHVEHELRMPYEKEYLMGVMDRMLVAADGTHSILHYKTLTIAAADLKEAARGYLPQLRIYAWLVAALNRKQQSVRATLLFTAHPEAPQTFTFSRLDLMRIEEELRSAIGDIRALSYTGRRELPVRRPHCPICPYFIEGRCLMDVAPS